MKSSQLIVAVAVAGLLGMSARASLPDGYSSAKIKLTVMMQAATTTTSSSAKFNTIKAKVTNKEMLDLIASQWDVTLADGSQLVLDNVWSGDFAVLNKDGGVVLPDVSSDESDWQLYTGVNNYVYTGKATDGSVSYKYSAIAYFVWNDQFDEDYLEIYGEASIKDSAKDSGSKEKFKISGADNGQWDGDSAVVSGTVSGSGKNNVLF